MDLSVLRTSILRKQQRTTSFAYFRNKKYESKLSIYYFFNLLKGFAFLCYFLDMAEARGFEPPRLLPTYTISSRAPSTTRPLFHLPYSTIVASNSQFYRMVVNQTVSKMSRSIPQKSQKYVIIKLLPIRVMLI